MKSLSKIEALSIDTHSLTEAGKTPLYGACEIGATEIFKRVLKNNTSYLNQADINGITPLHLASHRGYKDIVYVLLAHDNIEPNLRTGLGAAPLHSACVLNYIEIVNALLAHPKVDPNPLLPDGNNPLLMSVTNQNLDIIRALLAHDKIDPNLTRNDGWTPLLVACKKGYTDVVNLLLSSSKLKLNQCLNDGWTPFNIACYYGYKDIVKAFLEKKNFDVNESTIDQETPLQSACEKGFQEIVQDLLKHPQIQVNKCNNKGESPLHLACLHGHIGIVNALLEREDIDVNQSDGKGEFPLHIACKKDNTAITIALLSDPRTQVNQPNSEGESPLHIACEKGLIKNVKALLEREDTDVNHSNGKGECPLQISCQKGYTEIVISLITHFKIDWDNQSNRTNLLSLVFQNKDYTKIIELLIVDKNLIATKLGINIADLLSQQVYLKNLTLIRQFLKQNKFDPNAVTQSGGTLLHHACLLGLSATVDTLLTNGQIQTNVMDSKLLTPFMTAVMAKRTAVITTMLNHRRVLAFDPSIKNENHILQLQQSLLKTENTKNIELEILLGATYYSLLNEGDLKRNVIEILELFQKDASPLVTQYLENPTKIASKLANKHLQPLITKIEVLKKEREQLVISSLRTSLLRAPFHTSNTISLMKEENNAQNWVRLRFGPNCFISNKYTLLKKKLEEQHPTFTFSWSTNVKKSKCLKSNCSILSISITEELKESSFNSSELIINKLVGTLNSFLLPSISTQDESENTSPQGNSAQNPTSESPNSVSEIEFQASLREEEIASSLSNDKNPEILGLIRESFDEEKIKKTLLNFLNKCLGNKRDHQLMGIGHITLNSLSRSEKSSEKSSSMAILFDFKASLKAKKHVDTLKAFLLKIRFYLQEATGADTSKLKELELPDSDLDKKRKKRDATVGNSNIKEDSFTSYNIVSDLEVAYTIILGYDTTSEPFFDSTLFDSYLKESSKPIEIEQPDSTGIPLIIKPGKEGVSPTEKKSNCLTSLDTISISGDTPLSTLLNDSLSLVLKESSPLEKFFGVLSYLSYFGNNIDVNEDLTELQDKIIFLKVKENLAIARRRNQLIHCIDPFSLMEYPGLLQTFFNHFSHWAQGTWNHLKLNPPPQIPRELFKKLSSNFINLNSIVQCIYKVESLLEDSGKTAFSGQNYERDFYLLQLGELLWKPKNGKGILSNQLHENLLEMIQLDVNREELITLRSNLVELRHFLAHPEKRINASSTQKTLYLLLNEEPNLWKKSLQQLAACIKM
jgi:ankyrin repeat protein